jgi:DNA-binding response OmpR family regulator
MTFKPILLVEDDPDDEKRIMRGFERNEMAHIVYIARDGAEALEYLFGTVEGTSLRSPPPKLVILDLHLPRVPGMEVLRRIRAQPEGQSLFVIVFTGSRDEQERAEATGLGVDGYFQKPGDLKEFPKALEKIGLTWLVNTQ